MDLQDQIDVLVAEYEGACRDCVADNGEEIVDAGGWVELARAVASMPPEGVTEEAVKEFLRMQGLNGIGFVDWDDVPVW